MPDGQVLEFTNVTKRFNEVTAVSDFSARVEPGAVTAFLGPNGAGKTTTLRILLGQVRATSGTATIGGTTFAELRQPLRTIGSVLEETVYRPRRTANRQLTIAAKANGIPLSRVSEVLAIVGLDAEGDTRIGGFSLGMRQRLSVAHALLGDPGALVFDEPANGLDPEGIRWMRLLMRRLADEGRTVLVSSHLLSEIEQVADNVLVLSKGHLVLASGIETLADPKGGSVVVDAADRVALTSALSAAGFDIEVLRSGLTVRGGDAGTVGAVAAAAGIALSTLVQRGPTLEDVFIELVRGGKLGPNAGSAASQLVAPEGTGTGGEPNPGTDAAVSDETVVDPLDEDFAAAGPVEVDPALATEAEEEAEAETPAEAEAAAEQSDEHTVEVTLVETLESAGHHPADDVISAEGSAVDQADVGAPQRSFDEILFGGPAPAATSDEEGSSHSVADVFADADRSGDASDEATDQSEGGTDPAGLEIFDELGETDAADSTSADAEPDSTDSEGDDDPRSAAVSTMLAAAARAYYEDEPKDYPQQETSPDEGAQWSVASTGVIDTVPVAEPTETAPEEQSETGEPTDAGEQGEHHGGEHHEHHEHHDGEHHEHHEHHDDGDHGDHHRD